MVFPEWLELFRVAGTLLIWVMFPLQIFTLYRSHHQHRRWEEGEASRMARWQRDMQDAEKMREEAAHLRALTEVQLAMARRQVLLTDPAREEVE